MSDYKSRRRSRREVEVASMSFLDVISCGFGAIILLLVLSKVFEPINLEERSEELDGVIAKLEEEIFQIRGDVDVFNRDLESKIEQLSIERRKLARLQGDLSSIKGRYATTDQDSSVADIIESRLASAKQSLTAEMKRLLGASNRRRQDDTIGGIPVDSEYIIFIIDTSGSMFSYSWEKMIRTLEETLEVYPKVKGIQVMNDMGQYMFQRYGGTWIPDSLARRRAIVQRLRTWNPFSNSSPVEGIQRAITTFYAPDKKISLYVFGDEFTGPSIQQVVDAVDRMNRADDQGNRRVRIHAVGFPVQFLQASRLQRTGIRFATLMRILCDRNGGTFVGLNSVT